MSACETRGLKVLATRRYPGEAFEELNDVEIGTPPGTRPEVGAVAVANEAVPLDHFPSLRLVANFGVGYDRIDMAACAARGIAVTNTPGVLDAATADLAFALILAVRRRLVEGDGLVRAGRWSGSWSEGFLGREVAGATLGIVGLGRIGSSVARRARGFDMLVLYTGRTKRQTELAAFRPLDDLPTESDVVP